MVLVRVLVLAPTTNQNNMSGAVINSYNLTMLALYISQSVNSDM